MTDLTPEERANLLEEGKHLHDLAVARGMDTDRYRIVPGDETRIFPGPMFSVLEPDSWMQQKIDSFITKEIR